MKLDDSFYCIEICLLTMKLSAKVYEFLVRLYVKSVTDVVFKLASLLVILYAVSSISKAFVPPKIQSIRYGRFGSYNL